MSAEEVERLRLELAEVRAQLACIQDRIGEAIQADGIMPSSERLALMLHPLPQTWRPYLKDEG